MGALVSGGVLPLKDVATATLEAAVEEEGEDGQLVDGGSAWKLMGAVLQTVAQTSNQAQMSKQWKDTGLQLDAFFPSVSCNTGLYLAFAHVFVCSLTYPYTHSSVHMFADCKRQDLQSKLLQLHASPAPLPKAILPMRNSPMCTSM